MKHKAEILNTVLSLVCTTVGHPLILLLRAARGFKLRRLETFLPFTLIKEGGPKMAAVRK